MEYRDYYKILGVPKSASEKEIKSAYRKLARKYHPDVNPGDAAAETRFKEINEAHAVLSDPEKRKKFDALGPDWDKRMGPQYRPGGGTRPYAPGGQNPADFSDFFESLFGGRAGTGGASTPGGFDFDLGSLFGRGRGRSGTPAMERGQDAEEPIEVSLLDAYSGTERAYTVQSPQTCPTCHGTGVQGDHTCPTCGGAGSVPRTKRLDVKIPAGVRDGSRLRVAQEGNAGSPGAPRGDLYLRVHIQPDPRFRREGDDLYTDVSVPMTTLILGGETEVPTLNGRVTVRVPAGSQNGRTLRLNGQGMPVLKSDGRGSLYVKLNAVLPTQLNEQQRELFEQLQAAGV